MSIRRAVGILLLVLALPPFVIACGDTNPLGPPTTYHVSGRVTAVDALLQGTVTPLAGVVVNVQVPQFGDSPVIASQATGPDGKYDITFTARCRTDGSFWVNPILDGYYQPAFTFFKCKDRGGVLDLSMVKRF